MDALATPFVQGQLKGEDISVQVDTVCAHCQRPIQMVVSGDLDIHVDGEGAAPMLTVPMVDMKNLKEPSIIDAF
jgi:hypothetical protein